MANKSYVGELQHDEALGWRWGIFGWAENNEVVASDWFPSEAECRDDLAEKMASIGGSVIAS